MRLGARLTAGGGGAGQHVPHLEVLMTGAACAGHVTGAACADHGCAQAAVTSQQRRWSRRSRRGHVAGSAEFARG
eukprot:660864-Rhodomonas_salina.1